MLLQATQTLRDINYTDMANTDEIIYLHHWLSDMAQMPAVISNVYPHIALQTMYHFI